MGEECHQREKSQQRRGRSCNRQVRPLSLRFHAQVGAGFLEGDFHAPTRDVPLYDLSWGQRQVRSPKSRRLHLTGGVANQHPAQMNPGC